MPGRNFTSHQNTWYMKSQGSTNNKATTLSAEMPGKINVHPLVCQYSSDPLDSKFQTPTVQQQNLNLIEHIEPLGWPPQAQAPPHHPLPPDKSIKNKSNTDTQIYPNARKGNFTSHQNTWQLKNQGSTNNKATTLSSEMTGKTTVQPLVCQCYSDPLDSMFQTPTVQQRNLPS